MFCSSLRVRPHFAVLFTTATLLAPVVLATPAIQDLVDLRNAIQEAASTIGAEDNPNKGWGAGDGSQSQTATLVNNITMTILRSKWELDTNRTAWLTADNASNTSDFSNTTAWTPVVPLTASMVLPSVLPTASASASVSLNITIDLSAPYIDYVSTIPNLSSSLISLGRTYHIEMNAPVSDAIGALQQSMSALQSSMLQNNLITSAAVVRTVRASSSLEDAQQAWNRPLNLPGLVSGSVANHRRARSIRSENLLESKMENHRVALPKAPPAEGKYYTHQELWGSKKRKSEDRFRRAIENMRLRRMVAF